MNIYIIALLSIFLTASGWGKEPDKAIEEWSYSQALQAAGWSSPLVTMYALRQHITFGPSPKAPPNAIWRMEDISTPALSKEAGYVTPNVNVIYGFGFMDLRSEPVVVEAPDSNGRYYMIEIVDMWTNAFAYIGGKSTGYKGDKFILVGPGWKEPIPTGLKPIFCPTPWVLLQPRVHIYSEGEVDLAGAKKILEQIRSTPLSVFLKETPPPAAVYEYPALIPLSQELPVSVMRYKDPMQFWEVLMNALNENPPAKEQVQALLPLFKPLGIELGKPWNRSKLSEVVLGSMRKASETIGALLGQVPIGTMYAGAEIPPSSIGDFGTDYEARAVIARIGLTANQPKEAMYWIYAKDKKGDFLIGTKNYVLHFNESIPFEKPGFWSITLYDAINNYTVPNSLDRYMLGSDTRNLKKNEDGSFTIYIGETNPGKDKESNWLPAPPGRFYLIPRAYPPTRELVSLLTDASSWPIPVVEERE